VTSRHPAGRAGEDPRAAAPARRADGRRAVGAPEPRCVLASTAP